jgi:hypothetical protein
MTITLADPQRVGARSSESDGHSAEIEIVSRERKQVSLRLDPAVHDAPARWVSDEFRSLNAHIEMLRRRALDDAGSDASPGKTASKTGAATHPQHLNAGAASTKRDEGADRPLVAPSIGAQAGAPAAASTMRPTQSPVICRLAALTRLNALIVAIATTRAASWGSL